MDKGKNRDGAGLLCIRTEASERGGMGHVVRDTALAAAWTKRGGQVMFLLKQLFPPALEMIDRGRSEIVAGRESVLFDNIRNIAPVAVVVDTPRGSGAFCKRLLERGCLAVHIDDMGPATGDDSDIIVNPNLFTVARKRRFFGKGRVLKGPEYALLRPEFAQIRPKKPQPPQTKNLNILIMFGGTDVAELTPVALRAASRAPGVTEITAIVGSKAASREAVEAFARSNPKVWLCVNPPDIAALMASADLAIGAAGGTMMELACLGIPQIVCAVVQGQERNAKAWAELGAAVDMGTPHAMKDELLRKAVVDLVTDSERRAAMAAAGWHSVDGKGAERVAKEIERVVVSG